MSSKTPQIAVSHSLINTPIGEMLILCSDKGLQGCWFVGQKHFPPLVLKTPRSHTALAQAHHDSSAKQLALYFAHKIDQFNLILDLDSTGTLFQKEVWRALLSVPWGQTVSYGDIANTMGRPSSTRAVGSAVGKNPISIVIPCHRVIGKDGSLTGYAGGIERKKFLLNLESQVIKSTPERS